MIKINNEKVIKEPTLNFKGPVQWETQATSDPIDCGSSPSVL